MVDGRRDDTFSQLRHCKGDGQEQQGKTRPASSSSLRDRDGTTETINRQEFGQVLMGAGLGRWAVGLAEARGGVGPRLACTLRLCGDPRPSLPSGGNRDRRPASRVSGQGTLPASEQWVPNASKRECFI